MRTTSSDVALIGGGIMSATLASLLSRLEPSWELSLFEAQPQLATESSNAWNNAGTGHAALCELNYMPEGSDGSLDASKAIDINAQYQQSRELWSALVESGSLPDPSTFITAVPHMTFVRGEQDARYLQRRHELLRDHPLFNGMQFSEDRDVIENWAPLLTRGRDGQEIIAATHSGAGTDVDFGKLSELLIDDAVRDGLTVTLGARVRSIRRAPGGRWLLTIDGPEGRFIHTARFVFVGAGGGALPLLQSAGIREIRGYGGFPISGVFLRTSAPAVLDQHHAKVYGKAAVGAPPMSVPHLDARVVDGERSVLFGPYAGFSPKFLKSGSMLDLPASLRAHNLATMVGTGLGNLDLITYLVKELTATSNRRMDALREYLPTAESGDWELVTAGQRVQVMRSDPRRGGVLSFGTEVIASADGSIAGLLGASPGASTAVTAMLDVLQRCFPNHQPRWREVIEQLVPSAITPIADSPERAAASLERTSAALRLQTTPTRTN